MRTTLDLPDHLMREAKVRAARENRRLKDLMAELVRKGLRATDDNQDRGPARRVTLPIVQCAHRARPDDELTPDRVSEILLADETAPARRSRR
jgi:hypothetical protein